MFLQLLSAAQLDAAEIGVVAGGAALIALTLWYFFGPRERVAATTTAGGVQEVQVMVKGGYSPDVIVPPVSLPRR